MKKLGIYEVRTEVPSTLPGRTFDRFTIAGYGFEDAVSNAKKSGKMIGKERIQDVRLITETEA